MSLTNISPGEALLFIFKHDPKEKIELESLYLKGVKSEKDLDLLQSCLKRHSELLAKNNFIVDLGMQTRQKDGTRRNFETLIAFESTSRYIPPLGQHQRLLSLLSTEEREDIHLSNKALVQGLGSFSALTLGSIYATNEIIAEFQNYLGLDGKVLYEHAETAHANTLKMLVRDYITYFVLGNRQLKEPPFNIYGKGIFTADNRGRNFKLNNRQNQSIGNGLVFSLFAPLPESAVERSMPFTAEGNDNTRPKDGAAFPDLVKTNQTGIFINSISGTVLVMLRAILALHKQGQLIPKVYKDLNDLKTHVAAMIDANLYIVGGHSYFEYYAVIEELQKQDFGEDQSIYNDLIHALAEITTMKHLEADATKVLSTNDLLMHNQASLFKRRLNNEVSDSSSSFQPSMYC